MRDLSLHLLDILQNSISAKASKLSIKILTDTDTDELVMEIEDNGLGMEEEFARNITDPFVTTRTSRKVGLGIPLFKASAERSGGRLDIRSVAGKGTVVRASFKISHIDRLPLGDIGETIANVIAANPGMDVELTLENKGGNKFKFDTGEIREQLEGVPLNRYEVVSWIEEFVDEGIKTIFGGVLYEIGS